MTTQHKSVLIFGATGNVGHAAAIYAASLPNPPKITLALRDINKPTPDLPADKFPRVKADLTDPASLEKAAKGAGATAAFVYVAWGTKDAMKASFEALIRGGVQHIVLLSSFSVNPDNKSITPTDTISYAHASVEITLESLPISSTFVRPGSFTTNTYQWADQIKQNSTIATAHPDAPAAHIDTTDIGNVSAAVLVSPPAENHTAIYLVGPESFTVYDSAKVMGEVIGREVKVEELTEEEHRKRHPYVPAGVLDSIFKYQRTWKGKLEDVKDSENVKKYTGRDATRFREFVERNKEKFL
ncbi:hypothetical protein HDV00_002274 [Rhizophlyctis rosea]|nr:hypothetical protein HDV00_002274 [Rhizophlyctis rosea]